MSTRPLDAGSSRLARLAALVAGPFARWTGGVFWIAVLAVALPFANKLGSVETSRLTDFLPSHAASTTALQLDRKFPSGRDLQVEVVFYRASGLTNGDLVLARMDERRLVSKLSSAVGVPSGLVRSPDGTAAVMTVPVPGNDQVVAHTVTEIRAVVGNGSKGLDVRVTGAAAIQSDLLGAFSGADTLLLVATAALVAILLAASYRSPILWLVPLICVGAAEAVAQAVVYGLGRSGLTVNGQRAALVTVIVFGAGTDYALLITARYREELRRHVSHRAAMTVAWRRAAPAIAASS